MRRLALLLALAGCDGPGGESVRPEVTGAGAALERAAIARGVVADSTTATPVGVWARDGDRLCVGASENGRTDRWKVGVALTLGEQGCAAAGTASGRDRLDLRLGEDCRFEARVEDDRLTFPAELPAACQRLCTGRATLSALAVDRVGASPAEAADFVLPDGRRPCLEVSAPPA